MAIIHIEHDTEAKTTHLIVDGDPKNAMDLQESDLTLSVGLDEVEQDGVLIRSPNGAFEISIVGIKHGAFEVDVTGRNA